MSFSGLQLSSETKPFLLHEGKLCFLSIYFSYLLLHNKTTPNLKVLQQQFYLVVSVGQESGAAWLNFQSLIGRHQGVSAGAKVISTLS